MRVVVSKICGILGYMVQYGCIAHCTFEYVGDFVVCSGPSMEPTLFSDNVLITEHLSPRLNKIARGDIVIAKCPTDPKKHICKRVIGIPGDNIRTGNRQELVPLGHVWLEGDNSRNSADSRTYGPVPQGLIRSKAICRIWPIKDISLLTNSNF